MNTMNRIARTVAAAGFVIAATSLIVHPFGTVRTQDSQRPLFAGANSDTSVELLFVRACQNCHSERTVWPWYSYVAPVSWLLERDVTCARAHLNLSRWGEYSVSQRETLLATIGAAIRNRQMPPARFTLLHPDALLSTAEAEQIYRWAHTERRTLRHPGQRSSFVPEMNEHGHPDSAQ